jgi:hypothetical protein
MEKKQFICDQCDGDVNGSGFKVFASFADIDSMGISLYITHSEEKVHPKNKLHIECDYCGRNCLMLALNTIIDSIAKQGSAAETATAPSGD